MGPVSSSIIGSYATIFNNTPLTWHCRFEYDDGFTKYMRSSNAIAPGDSFTSNKMTLSLMLKGICDAEHKNGTNEEVVMEEIFTGLTDRSTITYDIQSAIEKWGSKNTGVWVPIN